ncbi:MAG: hypothetical protein HYX79_03695 [Chloroflexi bacterium]|nr:hypothetical protein [Chloroflexota bacterium]
MNLESVLQQVLNFTGTFNPELLILLYLICAIGEFGASVPYLLETVWLLSGYHVATGVISPLQLVALWATAQAGRQTGAATLYYLSRFGSMPLIKLYRRCFEPAINDKINNGNSVPAKFIRKVNYASPLSIATGRLFWLRIPITLTMAVKKKHATLAAGIVLQSLIWDGTYISLGGIVGASVQVKPLQMVGYSLVGLSVLYAVMFIAQRLKRWRVAQKPGKLPAP